MTAEEIDEAAARIQTCGELSGMEYEDTIDRIALQDAPQLLAEVRRLQSALDETEFRRWYFEAKLDAWASKAAKLERILQEEACRTSGLAKAEMAYAEDSFRKRSEAIYERLKKRREKHITLQALSPRSTD